jgi:hypothetical protein
VSDAFYVERDGGFKPTELTRGPWNAGAQHAGPPAALLGRALERCQPPAGARIARVTFEILRPVPMAPLTLGARVVRPGRSVELLEASLSDTGGEVMRATGWRLRTKPVELEPAPLASEPLPGPEAGEERPFFPTGAETGYHTAMEYRFLRGAFLEAGPATVWMRMRHPLLAGEAPSPLTRVLIAADSGNGVSAALDYRRFLFINADLSVHLQRLPKGEWVCLEATTFAEPDGVGTSDVALYDERGRIGRAAQTLLIRER